MRTWDDSYHFADHGWEVSAKDDGSTIYVAGNAQEVLRSNRMWLGKYSSDGTLMSWPSFPLAAYQNANDVAVGSDGSVYVIGSQWPGGVADFSDIFLGKINPSGSLVWSRIISTPSDLSPYGVGLGIIVAGENIYSTGTLNGKIWIQKFNAGDGVAVWSDPTLIPSPFSAFVSSRNQGNEIRVDSRGNVIVSGSTVEDLGPGRGATTHLWLAKLTSGGTVLWNRTYDDRNRDCYDFSCGLALDATGNIYVAALEPPPHSKTVVRKYDPDGNLLGVVTMESPDYGGYDIAVDACGNLYVAGRMFHNSSTSRDIKPWIGVFSPDFALLFSSTLSDLDIFSSNMFLSDGVSFPSIGQERAATSITLDSNGAFYLTGYYRVGDFTPTAPLTPFDINTWTMKFTPGSNPFAPRISP